MSTKKAAESGLIEVVLHRHTPTEPLSFGGPRLAVGPLSEFPKSGEAFSKPYQLSNSFYRRIIDGAVDELGRWGHRAVLQLNDNLISPALLGDINLRTDAACCSIGEYSPDLLWFITRCQKPLVLVDLVHDGWPDVVTTDNLVGNRCRI